MYTTTFSRNRDVMLSRRVVTSFRRRRRRRRRRATTAATAVGGGTGKLWASTTTTTTMANVITTQFEIQYNTLPYCARVYVYVRYTPCSEKWSTSYFFCTILNKIMGYSILLDCFANKFEEIF